MIYALLLTFAVAEPPSAAQLALLRTFRTEFVSVTPGKGKFPPKFAMGEEAKEVAMKSDFSIGKYEVTQDVWQAVMGSNPSIWKGPTRKRNSVEMITYDEAVEFCKRTTTLMRAAKLIEMKEEIRLPTESEWEYATRAGTKTAYSFGDDANKLDDYAWSTRNAAGNDPPVGAKKPNPWGLYDVHGYLWEWCLSDEKNVTKSIKRGGSWKDGAAKLKSSSRVSIDKKSRDDAVGLRCVLAKVQSQQQSKE